MDCVNEVVAPFIPLVTTIITLTKEIANAYEDVQYNKKTCGILVNRVEAAEAAIKGLMREREENIHKFRSQEKIKDFCYDISQLSKFKKFFTSGNIKESFQEIIKEFDGCLNDLNLAISITSSKNMNRYLTILHCDMIEMKKFLDDIGSGITSKIKTIDDNTKTHQEIISIITNVESMKKLKKFTNKLITKSLTIERVKRIPPNELEYPPEYDTRVGNRVIIQKKTYKAMDVACKHFLKSNNIQKIQNQLNILIKLNICPHIIQFLGLSKIVDKDVMIFEWADLGTLREVYLKYEIGWDMKISLARDICHGLAFLHSVDILHHDLKCENILIKENMQPKISKFNFAREINAETCHFDDLNDIVHWLAPEKLKCIPAEQNLEGNKKPEEELFVAYNGALSLKPITRKKVQESELDIHYYNSDTSSTPSILFDEGLKAHKTKNYERAWKCFEEHASNGHVFAQFKQ
ncbi:7941_t:CDS:2, partial [Funneliformis caledonium]